MSISLSPRVAMVVGCWLLLAHLPIRSAVAAEEAWVDASVNTRLVQLGEPFRLVLTAGARNGLVFLPGAQQLPSGCRLLQYQEKDVSSEHEGFYARQGTYALAGFIIPELFIPSLTVRVRWTQGRTSEIHSMPMRIAIKSMRPAAGLALIDPRPPHPSSKIGWYMLAGGVVLACGWWFLRRPRNRSGRRRRGRTVEAHSQAYQALALLERTRFEDRKQEFIEISRIVRQYLSRRFEFPALEQSRQLIVQNLQRLGVEAKCREWTDKLLAETDLMKFSLEPADEVRKDRVMILLREIIEMTKERPELAAKRKR